MQATRSRPLLHMGLLDFPALSGGGGGALVLVLLHIGCRRQGQKTGEEDQLHDEIAVDVDLLLTS